MKDLFAPEVVDFQITYYGGTAGTSSTATSGGTSSGSSSSSGTANNGTTTGGTTSTDTTTNGTTNEIQWDSTQEGMLPVAVKISISLRRDEAKSIFSMFSGEKRAPVVYSMLVDLPNAGVESSQSLQQAVDTTFEALRGGIRQCWRPRSRWRRQGRKSRREG